MLGRPIFASDHCVFPVSVTLKMIFRGLFGIIVCTRRVNKPEYPFGDDNPCQSAYEIWIPFLVRPSLNLATLRTPINPSFLGTSKAYHKSAFELVIIGNVHDEVKSIMRLLSSGHCSSPRCQAHFSTAVSLIVNFGSCHHHSTSTSIQHQQCRSVPIRSASFSINTT